MNMNKATSNAFRLIAQSRRSAKNFVPNKSIDSSILQDVIQSSIRSPSSFNLQPTQIIVIQSHNNDDKLQNDLAKNAMLGWGNQQRVQTASAIAVFLSDLQVHHGRIERIHRLEQEAGMRDAHYMAKMPLAASLYATAGGNSQAYSALHWTMNQLTSTFNTVMTSSDPNNQQQQQQQSPPQKTNLESMETWSYKNTALMAQTFVLAATSHGLSTCIMEGFDNNRVKEILQIPDRYGIPMMVALGYSSENDNEDKKGATTVKMTPRLSIQEVCFDSVFGQELDFSNNNDDGDDEQKEVAV